MRLLIIALLLLTTLKLDAQRSATQAPQSQRSAVQQPSARQPAQQPVLGERIQQETFSLQVPEGWQTGSNAGGLFYAVSPPSNPSDIFSENFTVYSEKVTSNVDLKQYFADAISGLKEIFPDVEVEGQGEAEIDGVPAGWLRYTITVGGRTFEFLQYCVIKDGKAYVLTGAADSEQFDEYLSTFEEILHSFRFEEATK